MDEVLTEHNCVTAEFWDFENDDAEEDESEVDDSGDNVPSAEQNSGTGTSLTGRGVITWQLQKQSWDCIKKALRSCMEQFLYQEHDDVQHKYYVLNDEEVGLVKFFAEEEIRKRHPDSVTDYQAVIEEPITQIDKWGEWSLWELWHDYINQLLDRASMLAEYYAINVKEGNRQEAEYEKREKLREKLREESRFNQRTHSQASSGGEVHNDLEVGALEVFTQPNTANEARRKLIHRLETILQKSAGSSDDDFARRAASR
ncbi:hypothetical protein N0V91_006907 [Didymella pomorum]|uniref:Uncharacterized protein n=1 Tax=Didymella pomorum TaxID=749634 RepID=A0A9W9D5U1_9PLEO|nr:hypothetical protein N0V91_006907 [Didymella pomorum]